VLLDHDGNNAFDGLLDDSESVCIVSLDGVRSDRDEDREQVLQNEIRDESGERRDEEESLLERLRVSAVGDDLDDSVDVDLASGGEGLSEGRDRFVSVWFSMSDIASRRCSPRLEMRRHRAQ
jgi:hypothetical protein